MGQNRMQKNQKDIIYHEMIRRLTRRSAVISHILGIETSSTSGETINPELVSFLDGVNDDLSFDFKNLINAIHELDNSTGGLEIIEIGEITFEDLNSATLGATEIDFVFVDKKPADKYIVGLFFKNITEFATHIYYGYTINSIADVFLKKNSDEPLISTGAVKLPQSVVEDITVGIVLTEENEQEWISGSFKIYAEVKSYPTLT